MTWQEMSPRTPFFLLQAIIGPPRRCALQDSRQYASKTRTTDAARSRPLRAPARNSGTTLPPSEALRSIRLPEDKKGRKALLEATTLWKEQWEKNGGTAPQLHRPVTLAIDDRPTTQNNLITPTMVFYSPRTMTLGKDYGALQIQCLGQSGLVPFDGLSMVLQDTTVPCYSYGSFFRNRNPSRGGGDLIVYPHG